LPGIIRPKGLKPFGLSFLESESYFMIDGHIKSFNPIGDKNATVLVLGTMPGQESLNKSEYYANRRNLFWNIMGELFGAGFYLEYEQRRNILIQSGIAVWDVLKCCKRKGSGDLAIESEIANDFNAFFHKYSKIRGVFFNGKNAEKFYHKLVLPHLAEKYRHIIYKTLPSTSPANAHMDFQMKLTEWYAVKKRC
jgi:double-stranded uracil-DNA glycosylase